jgi:hypothetical protein
MTVGWIFEGDRDRLLAVREQTPNASRVEVFSCPFCKQGFSTPTKLDAHVQDTHSVKRPFLLFNGREPSTDDVLRPSQAAITFKTFNCDEIYASIDGEPARQFTENSLTTRLRRLKWSLIRLELHNRGDGLTQRVAQKYLLTLIAPDDRSLADIDELFLRVLGTKDARMESISHFHEMTRDPPISEYAEALGDYVRAVLIKDDDPRTGVSTRLHHHHEIQNKVLNILARYQRPLASLLCSILRFNLNDFSRWNEPSGFSVLDNAYAILGPLSHPRPARKEQSSSKNESDYSQQIPIDFGTNSVAELAKLATNMSRWGADAERYFLALAESAATDPFDRTKARAIWASTALRLGAQASAHKALQLLEDDPTFGTWANRIIEEAFP